MKTMICITTILLTFASITFSQSVIVYQTGTGITVDSGAGVCADTVIINGTFSGGGTICGSSLYVLNIPIFLEGFYNSLTNAMVSDTVKVYLRNTTIPYALVDSSKSVLSSSGIGTFNFSNISNGTSYYIIIKHRNSIETWSSAGNIFTSGTLTYDFTTAANKAYGNNQIQIDNSPVRFGIYSGDVNQDGVVDVTDASLIDNDLYNFASGYVATDLN
ncbi:MAG: hypothetical protein ABI840_11320, partial [bacterium]